MTSKNTNTIRSLCPKCNEHIPQMEVKRNQLSIECKCGFRGSMTLSDYIIQYNTTPNRILVYINRCEEHKKLFTIYCEKCKKVLCNKCREEHKSCNKIYFIQLRFPDRLNKIKENIIIIIVIKYFYLFISRCFSFLFLFILEL